MAYGKDLGLQDGITQLLRELTRVDGLHWIRFLYCYPHSISNDLIRLVAEEAKLCKYFDIPYQHASRSVLDRMKRGGHRELYERQIDGIRNDSPDAVESFRMRDFALRLSSDFPTRPTRISTKLRSSQVM